MGLGGSSVGSGASEERRAVVLTDDDCDEVDTIECDRAGVSKKGSLGARARFGVTVVVAMATAFCFVDGNGCDRARTWACGANSSAFFPEEARHEDGVSSKARTLSRHEVRKVGQVRGGKSTDPFEDIDSFEHEILPAGKSHFQIGR
jgi:hypothetical protein